MKAWLASLALTAVSPLAMGQDAGGRILRFTPAPGATLQSAIDAASNGDTILVPPGTYDESISLAGKAISLIGAQGPRVTILTWSGGYSGFDGVVECINGEGRDTLIQGFTIRDSKGIGVLSNNRTSPSSSGTPTVRDCIIRGHMNGVVGDVRMERCVVVDNGSTATPYFGSGVSGSSDLRDCVIARNIGWQEGGGLAIWGDTTIDGCVISDNFCKLEENGSQGAGVYVGPGGSAAISNTVIAFNAIDAVGYGGYGAAVFADGSATLTNCTVVENSTYNGEVGGVIWGDVTLVNTILRDNTPSDWAGASARYSNLDVPVPGPGNINAPPGFVFAGARDYHVVEGAPGIDAGDPALLDPDGTRSDIGAFHFQRLYTKANTTPSSWLDPSWSSVSLRVGGRHELGLLFGPGRAGDVYRVLGSYTGTSPGVAVRGVLVPLNFDRYTQWTYRNASPSLLGFLGTLDGSGEATVSITVPPGQNPALAGLRLHHAAGVFASRLVEASNAAHLDLVP